MPQGKSLEIRLRAIVDKTGTKKAVYKVLKEVERSYTFKINPRVANVSGVKKLKQHMVDLTDAEKKRAKDLKENSRAEIRELNRKKALSRQRSQEYLREVKNRENADKSELARLKSLNSQRSREYLKGIKERSNAEKQELTRQRALSSQRSREYLREVKNRENADKSELARLRALSSQRSREYQKEMNREKEIFLFRESMQNRVNRIRATSGRFMTSDQSNRLSAFEASMGRLRTDTPNLSREIGSLRNQFTALNDQITITANNSFKFTDSLKEAAKKFPIELGA
jgi:hypothetical protein